MSETYLCRWPLDDGPEDQPHEVTVPNCGLPIGDPHLRAAEIAAEECGRTLHEQTIEVWQPHGRVHTFVVERQVTPQFLATEVE